MTEPNRTYRKPTLRRYGKLAELTRAVGGVGAKDGGKGKNANKTGL